MADSPEKRQRERRKRDKKRQKEQRKGERKDGDVEYVEQLYDENGFPIEPEEQTADETEKTEGENEPRL